MTRSTAPRSSSLTHATASLEATTKHVRARQVRSGLFALVFALVATVEGASAAMIDFDDLPAGTVISRQYESLGVVFEGAPRIVPAKPVSSTTLPNVLESPYGLDLPHHPGPMRFRFTSPQRKVGVRVGLRYSAVFDDHAILRVYDGADRLIARRSLPLGGTARDVTMDLEIDAGSNRIRRAEVHYALETSRDGVPVDTDRSGVEAIDNLRFEVGSEARCVAVNGDVNADGVVDVSDGISILGNLFLGDPKILPPLCTILTGSCGLPDTGQTTCHDETGEVIDCTSDRCRGQDGAYARGCPTVRRFVDNGDGTVTDSCTGLMWQKETADVNRDGRSTGDDSIDWRGALDYSEGLRFAGYSDWRLPNVRELSSIVDYGRDGPAIDPIFGPFSGGWSSTPFQTITVFVWVVLNGHLYPDETVTRRHRFRVVRSTDGAGGGEERCVTRDADVNADRVVDLSDGITILRHLFLGDPRKLPPLCRKPPCLPDTGRMKVTWLGDDGSYATGCPPEGRFVDNGDGTVTDACTRLIWQKVTADVNGDGVLTDLDRVDWCSALAYCVSLELGGYDDWRLPNVRELETIVDYGRIDPAIDPVFRALSSDYWSSTSVAGSPAHAWSVTFQVGGISSLGKEDKERSYLRAVRSGP